jgi:hypothetical protein
MVSAAVSRSMLSLLRFSPSISIANGFFVTIQPDNIAVHQSRARVARSGR